MRQIGRKAAVMTEIEKIKRYIDNSPYKDDVPSCYSITSGEWIALTEMALSCPHSNAASSPPAVDAIYLAFEYGRAKGERHARSEMKRKRKGLKQRTANITVGGRRRRWRKTGNSSEFSRRKRETSRNKVEFGATQCNKSETSRNKVEFGATQCNKTE